MHYGKPVADSDADDLYAVSEVLRGNTEAFRRIVDRHRGLVYRLALSSLGNREEADEAAQEIFIRAFKSLAAFRIEKRFLPWLYSIAANHLRTRAVRLRRVEGGIVRDAQVRIAAPSEDDPQVSVERTLLSEELRRAVNGLPPMLRDPVRLYYFEGLDVEGVCSVLGLGPENVKSRLMRARKALKRLLERGATGGMEPGYTDVGKGEDHGHE